MNQKKKRYLNIALWGFPPYGGGEYFLLDTMLWAKELDMDTFFLCFYDPTHGAFPKTNLLNNEYGWIVQSHLPIEKCILHWLKEINPDIVHCQGFKSDLILHACRDLGIPTIYGLHYWTELLNLKSEGAIVNLLMRPLGDFEVLSAFRRNYECATYTYANSEFTRKVYNRFSNIDVNNIIMPVPRYDSVKVDSTGDYITALNMDIHKGGDLLIALARLMPEYKFLGVDITYRLNDKDLPANLILLKGPQPVKDIYAKTKIVLIPSLVDESFGRGAVESFYNGIPIITTATGTGNIPYILGEAGRIIDSNNIKEWSREIRLLQTDNEYYTFRKNEALKQAKIYHSDKVKEQFKDVIKKCL